LAPVPWTIAPGTGAKVRAGEKLRLVDRSMMVLQRPA
jgi:glycogen operon protein